MPRTAVQAFLHRARDNDISLVAFNRVSERRQSSIPVAMRAWVLARRMQVIKLTVSPRPLWVVCHEHHRSKRRCGTVREMKEGPSGSAIR